jgi:hypothetical protein
MAHLDQAIGDSLDLPRFFAGQPGKRGRGPVVTGRTNLWATAKDGNPSIFVNGGPGDMRLSTGHVLKSPDRSSGTVSVSMADAGVIQKVRMTAKILHHPKLSRGLHKIAVETIALFLGCETARGPSLEEVRRYVQSGDGPSRRVLVLVPVDSTYWNCLWTPYECDVGYCVVLRLAGLEFSVDCTPGQQALPTLKENASRYWGSSRQWRVI